MKVIKLIIILGISAIAFCININVAYADSNSFAAGTLISTPQGNTPIEELNTGDRIIGYKFDSHENKINKISSIEQKSSLSYYLINNKIKTVGTQFVYKKTDDNPEVVRVHQLKEGDRLMAQEHQDYLVERIEQVVEPLQLYKINLDREENFFTDRFLVYSRETVDTNNKNHIYLDCDLSTGSYRCFKVNPPTIPGVLITLLTLMLAVPLTDRILKWISFNNR